MSFTFLPNFTDTTGSLRVTRDSLVLANAIRLVGDDATALTTGGSTVPRAFFGTKSKIPFTKDVEYTLAFDLSCVKANNGFEGKVEIYLVGTSFPNSLALGQLIGTYRSAVGNDYDRFENETINVKALNTGLAHLRFVIYSGQWHAANVSIKPATEFGFHPDSTQFLVAVDNYKNDQLKFRVELYDANNNFVPNDLETPPVLFDGGTLAIRGDNNRIHGSLIISPSGSGPVLGVDASGSYIGIGSGKLPRPLHPNDLAGYTGQPIVTIYSGSTPYTNSTASGSGIQITGGIPGGSFFDFNTITGRLTIRGEIELLPGTPLSASIVSGSGGSSGSDAGDRALAQLQNLVNASGSFPSGTFLNGYMVRSPIILGDNGYFSSSFGVGDISGGKGIVLTAKQYLNQSGVIVSGSAIYMGIGRYANANTPFFVASGSGGSLFSLGSALTWDGSSLTVNGAINVTGGDAATKTYAIGTATNAESSASANVTGRGLSTLGNFTGNVNGVAASTVQAGSTLANSNLNASGLSSVLRGVNIPALNPSVAGLYMTSGYLGFHNGNGTLGGWTSYIASDGKFYFTGNGSNNISWDSATLTIKATAFNLSTSTLKVDSTNNNGYIALGAATAYGTGNGFYVDGTGILRIGNPSGNRLQWDGTNLFITGSDFTVANVYVDYIRATTAFFGHSFKTGSSNISAGIAYGLNYDFIGGVQLSTAGGNKTIQLQGTLDVTLAATINGLLSLGSNVYMVGTSAFYRTTVGTGYDSAALQIRERSLGGTNAFEAPRLALHWGGVVASQISIESGGRISFRNQDGSAYQSVIGNDIYGAAFYTTSTRIAKKNIEVFSDSALDLLKSVKVVKFNYIEDRSETPKVGFIAEDTNSLLATPKHDSMDTANSIALLIKAVQELKEENNELRAAIREKNAGI